MSYKRSADQAALNHVPQPQIAPNVIANTQDGILVDNVLLAEELLKRRQNDNPQSINDAHVAVAINNAANAVNQPLLPILQQLQQGQQQLQQNVQQLQQNVQQLHQGQQQLQQGQQQLQQVQQQLLNRTSVTRQAALNCNVRANGADHHVWAVPHQDTGNLPPQHLFPADLTYAQFQDMTAPQVDALLGFYGLSLAQGTAVAERRRALARAIGLY